MEKIGAVLERELPKIKEQVREQEEKKEREKSLELVGFSDMCRKGFTSIPNYLWDLEISLQAKVLYSLLLSYCWNKNFCFPGQKEIAEKMRIMVPHISRYFKELQEVGLIKTIQRGLGKTNKYILYATAKNYKE